MTCECYTVTLVMPTVCGKTKYRKGPQRPNSFVAIIIKATGFSFWKKKQKTVCLHSTQCGRKVQIFWEDSKNGLFTLNRMRQRSAIFWRLLLIKKTLRPWLCSHDRCIACRSVCHVEALIRKHWRCIKCLWRCLYVHILRMAVVTMTAAVLVCSYEYGKDCTNDHGNASEYARGFTKCIPLSHQYCKQCHLSCCPHLHLCHFLLKCKTSCGLISFKFW